MYDSNQTLKSLSLEPTIIELVDSGRYDDAIQMIKTTTHEPTPLLIRKEAYCYFKLDRITYALEALKKAETRGWLLPDILLLKGQCLYRLQEWETALLAFEAVDKIASTNETKQWITRCQAHISVENAPNSPNIYTFDTPIISDVKKQWYQQNQLVGIQLLIKDVNKDELKVTFLPKSVDVYINRQRPISVHVNLPKEIVPESSTYVLNDSSIELKLKKVVAGYWETCEL